MDCNHTTIQYSLPWLERTYCSFICQTKVFKAAQGICFAVFARDSLVDPTCVAKESVVPLRRSVEAEEGMILLDSRQGVIGNDLACDLSLLLQILPKTVWNEEVMSCALIGKQPSWLRSNRPIEVVCRRGLKSVGALIVGCAS